jgi:hypothetical protein
MDRATSDFTISSRMNVRYTAPLVNRSILLFRLGMKDKGQEDLNFLNEYIANHTINGIPTEDLSTVFYNRGSVKEEWHDFEGALQDYTYSIEQGFHSPHYICIKQGLSFDLKILSLINY